MRWQRNASFITPQVATHVAHRLMLGMHSHGLTNTQTGILGIKSSFLLGIQFERARLMKNLQANATENSMPYFRFMYLKFIDTVDDEEDPIWVQAANEDAAQSIFSNQIRELPASMLKVEEVDHLPDGEEALTA